MQRPASTAISRAGHVRRQTEDPVFIELEDARSDYAVEPYLARVSGEDATITLAYYGAPLAPGFGYSTIFTDEEVFSSSSSILKAGRQWRAETSSSRTMRTLNRSELRLSNCSQSEIPDFRASQLLSERKPSASSTSCRLKYKSGVDDRVAPPVVGSPEATPSA